MKDLLAKPEPSINEFVFMFILAVGFVMFFTVIDMTVHDGYVRPIVAECYESNLSAYCEERRFELLSDLPLVKLLKDYTLSEQDEQLRLGGQYWMMLLVIVIVFSAVMGGARIVLGKLAGAETNPMLFIIGGLWSYSTLALYYFGWLDYLYFAVRKITIPDKLEWLDGVGLFQYVQRYGATSSVDDSDLFILMAVGLFLFISVWVIMIHHHKKGTLEKLGLI